MSLISSRTHTHTDADKHTDINVLMSQMIDSTSFILPIHTQTHAHTHFMFSRASSSPQKWRLIHYRYQTCQVQLTVVHRIGSHCLCCHLRFAEDLGKYIRGISLSLPGSLYCLLYTYAWCVMLLCLCTCISQQKHGTLFVYKRLVSFFYSNVIHSNVTACVCECVCLWFDSKAVISSSCFYYNERRKMWYFLYSFFPFNNFCTLLSFSLVKCVSLFVSIHLIFSNFILLYCRNACLIIPQINI